VSKATWSYTKAYNPEAQKRRDESVEWAAGKVREAAVAVHNYGTREEFLAWAGEIFDSVVDDYHEWLSTQ